MEYESQPTRGLPIVSPANMLPVQVIHREQIAPDVVTVYIVLPGTRQAPAPYLAGQFVTLALPTSRETLYRSYSLCSDGDVSRPWELTIKRMEMGAVSTYFFDSVQRGTLLYASLPRGTFTLPARLEPQAPLAMVALGSGITPIMGMLRAINRMPADKRPFVHLHYASRSPEHEIFGAELMEMDLDQRWLRQWPYYSEYGDRFTPEMALARSGTIAKRAEWYMCGPEGVKHELQGQLQRLGVARSQIHSEVFATHSGPAYSVDRGSGGADVGGRITIGETGATIEAQPQDTLLTALERNGYQPAYSCRAGSCGTCKLRVRSGQVNPVGEALSDADRSDGYVLSCIAHPIGDVTVEMGGAAAAVPGAAQQGVVGHSQAKVLVRLGAVVGVGALLYTSWNLTDHRPSTWAQTSVSAVSPNSRPASGAAPSASPQPPAPAPTATSAPRSVTSAPQPPATPKPQPVATATPSPAH